jgi:hypothetical protein
MSFHVEISPEQARVIAAIAEGHDAPVALRQLVDGTDVYATVQGRTAGYRIAHDGTVTPVADVLPGP